MKKFIIPVDVTSFNGTQYYRVLADTAEEAVEIFKKDGGDFVEEETEVMGLDTENISVNDVWVED